MKRSVSSKKYVYDFFELPVILHVGSTQLKCTGDSSTSFGNGGPILVFKDEESNLSDKDEPTGDEDASSSDIKNIFSDKQRIYCSIA